MKNGNFAVTVPQRRPMAATAKKTATMKLSSVCRISEGLLLPVPEDDGKIVSATFNGTLRESLPNGNGETRPQAQFDFDEVLGGSAGRFVTLNVKHVQVEEDSNGIQTLETNFNVGETVNIGYTIRNINGNDVPVFYIAG